MRMLGALLLLVTLTACTPGLTVKEESAPATERGPLFITKDDIEVDGESAIKGEQKVAIPVFRVGFTTSKDRGAHATGILSSGTGTATVTSHTNLLGIDQPIFQEITDQVYRHFVTELKAAGFDVLEHTQLEKQASYADMSAVDNPLKIESNMYGNLVYVAPTGMKLALMPGEEGGLSAFKALSSNNPARMIPKLINELGMSVITATYYVDFVNTEADGGLIATKAEVSIGPGLSIRPGSGVDFYGYEASKCKGFCPDMAARVKLGQAVYSQEKFGELVNVTDDTGTQVALNAVTGLLTGSVKRWYDLEMRADPNRYRDITVKLLENTNDQLIQTLKTHR